MHADAFKNFRFCFQLIIVRKGTIPKKKTKRKADLTEKEKMSENIRGVIV